MCGRTACTLHAESLGRACEYKDASGRRRKVEWQSRENAGREYAPSCNVAPTDVTPCIVAGSHFENEQEERVLYPMVWGMIPPWHKEDYRKSRLSTHNCRLEGVSSSKLYLPPLKNGKRCVMVCDGYYEWKTTEPKSKGPKQPYFIYAKQEENVKVEDSSTWSDEWSEDEGWKGMKLLKLAGLFDVWKSPQGETVYSHTVLTMEANEVLSWLHHRTPVFLETEEDVANWLDHENVSMKDALAKLRNATKGALAWHMVDPMVNNSRCKSFDCNKPVKCAEKKKSNPTSLLASWLKMGTAAVKDKKQAEPSEEGDEDEPKPKRSKIE